ncbi:MAG: flavodoxin family protein [Anaerolineae bacterium]|nr:flavodoxin family protein [Anaerolineae bacterium]
MHVVVINGSPKRDKSNTTWVLTPFLEGMKAAGAEVELFYTKDLDIKPCQGDFYCWLKNPGKCFQKDDMAMLLPKVAQADVLVLATPVYVDGISGPLKNLMDRMIPTALPFIELRDGHCRHLRHVNIENGKLVLVSNSGFWELDNFDPLLVHMKAFCKNSGREFAGALLRPHGSALKMMMDAGAPVNDVFDAAREAGRQLVEEGAMSPETLLTVSRTLLPLEAFLQTLNQRFQAALDAAQRE